MYLPGVAWGGRKCAAVWHLAGCATPTTPAELAARGGALAPVPHLPCQPSLPSDPTWHARVAGQGSASPLTLGRAQSAAHSLLSAPAPPAWRAAPAHKGSVEGCPCRRWAAALAARKHARRQGIATASSASQTPADMADMPHLPGVELVLAHTAAAVSRLGTSTTRRQQVVGRELPERAASGRGGASVGWVVTVPCHARHPQHQCNALHKPVICSVDFTRAPSTTQHPPPLQTHL